MARHPLINQAKTEALVRYGPEKSALKNILRDALTTYQTASATADQAATAIKKAAQIAKPEIAHIYDQADASRKDAQHEADLTLGALAQDASTPMGFALQRERAAQATHSSTERASSLSDLTQRAVSAQEGRAYAKQNALATYQSSQQEVGSRALDLAREEGAFTQGRVGQLRKENRDYNAKIRGQNITKRGQDISHADRQATLHQRKVEAQQREADAKKPKPLTHGDMVQVRKDTATATGAISRIQSFIKQLKDAGADSGTIKSLLLRGGSVPYTDTYTGKNSKGQNVQKVQRKELKVPAFHADYVKAAFELTAPNGFLSQGTVHKLRVDHNVHVPKQWLPPSTDQGKRKRISAGLQKQAAQVEQIVNTLGNVGK